MTDEISPKHKQFINEYLRCWNGSEAYRRVYPNASIETSWANSSELLRNTKVSAEIKRRVAEHTMSADEVLARQTDIGRSDIGEFINLTPEEIKQSGRSRLIRKFSRTTTTTIRKDSETKTESFTVEMYDAQAAQVQMGKYHDLFVDKLNVKIEKELDNALDILEKQLDGDTYKQVLNALSRSQTADEASNGGEDSE